MGMEMEMEMGMEMKMEIGDWRLEIGDGHDKLGVKG